MSFSIIAAIGKNNELGKNNDLIWHLPNDLKYFKEVTTGKIVVMGKNTFDSLPKVLPNRTNIVLCLDDCVLPEEVIWYKDFNKFIVDYKDSKEEIFVIGGASIYKLFLDYADKLYLTEINAEDSNATVYFPKFNKAEWNAEMVKENTDNGILYKHVIYRREVK